ncbi:hypothetical protein VTO73DRAFT_9723 [Trametes versicolor]
MVFARLAPSDKDAFFALLDEYFASRPDLFNGSGSGESSTGGMNGVPAGPAGRAQNAAASAVSSAFSQAANRSADANGWKRPNAAATAEIGNSVGRVAAAAAALKLNPGEQTPSGNGGFPRPPARRMNTGSSNEEPPPPEHAKLTPTRKFGDVDMSSGKNMFNSLRNSTAAKHAAPAQVAPPTPPAFQRKNDFAPPPRRVPSTGSSRSSVISNSAPPPPIPRRTQEPEESGEWAEAMYDYHSEDPGDLDLQEGVRVLILEKTSDDWWTGEIDGQRGLVPAAYVKML